MKKFYFLASVLLAAFTIQAQTTIDFEEITLTPETYIPATSGDGTFVSKGATFHSYYFADWDWWTSWFAPSNMTDNTTAGFTNEGSAYPASGANSSSNYVVFLSGDADNGYISFDDKVDMTSMAITNTTYAFLSMRDGDGLAKIFGENGDKDFFYVDIYGIDGNDTIATTRFYLADFTSDEATDHYIVDSWENVDLSAFQGITQISFHLTTSDMGTYGPNTPFYFALDDLIYAEHTLSLNEEQAKLFKMYPNPAQNTLYIEGEGSYEISNLNGQYILTINANQKTDISHIQPGIYLVTNQNQQTQKLIIH